MKLGSSRTFLAASGQDRLSESSSCPATRLSERGYIEQVEDKSCGPYSFCMPQRWSSPKNGQRPKLPKFIVAKRPSGCPGLLRNTNFETREPSFSGGNCRYLS